jgi:hypothetical protein
MVNLAQLKSFDRGKSMFVNLAIWRALISTYFGVAAGSVLTI